MFNPFSYLGSAAGKVVADGWTAICLGVWNAGLWLLNLVLTLVDNFTTPDLSEGGPGAEVYKVTFWIALTLMITLSLAQLGISAFRRDGRSVAQLLVGTGQFLMVWAASISYGVALIAAVGGLTKALMKKLLHIDKWAQFDPLGTKISGEDISDGTVATVLMILGVFLVFGAIGHFLVMVTRAGSLIVLSATTPIAAAGLSSDVGRGWFWKSFRWFHAAAFTPVLMVLVLGIGVQMTSGVATGGTSEIEKAIGTAVPGVVLICVACFSPLALFKLLAFTDPGTTSGAAMRAGLAAQGGVTGLLGGLGGQASSGSSAASSTDENGKSQAESAGEDSTSSRFNGSAAGMMGKFGGALGQAGAAGMGAMEKIGSTGAAVGADLTNQMGVGHNNYVPDFTAAKRGSGGRPKGGDGDDSQGGGSGGPEQDIHPAATGTDGSPTPSMPTPPTPPLPTSPGGAGTSPGGGGGMPTPGAGGAGAEGAGAAGAGAGAVPIVPV